jgi:hypothetical protein
MKADACPALGRDREVTEESRLKLLKPEKEREVI